MLQSAYAVKNINTYPMIQEDILDMEDIGCFKQVFKTRIPGAAHVNRARETVFGLFLIYIPSEGTGVRLKAGRIGSMLRIILD